MEIISLTAEISIVEKKIFKNLKKHAYFNQLNTPEKSGKLYFTKPLIYRLYIRTLQNKYSNHTF